MIDIILKLQDLKADIYNKFEQKKIEAEQKNEKRLTINLINAHCTSCEDLIEQIENILYQYNT